jgi:uncharacterized protein YuzE
MLRFDRRTELRRDGVLEGGLVTTPWVSFDSRADALVVVFADVAAARTEEASEGRAVDFDDAGNVVAIEVTGVSGGFALDDLAEQFDLRDELRAVELFLPKQFYKHYA